MRGKALLLEERELILRGICEELSDRAIGRRIGRNQSVITREINNNGSFANTSQRAPTSRATLKPSLMRSRQN
jgi:IS30 family transposase